MKRRSHGVNLDDGVALSSQEDLDRLYVPARQDQVRRLGDWFADPQAEAIVFAGQIGSGKSTHINQVLHSARPRNIVRVEFDRVPLEETQGAFLAVLFGSLLSKALAVECSCDGLGVSLSDFGEPRPDDWGTLRNILLEPPRSLADAARIRQIYVIFGENAAQGRKACGELVSRIQTKLGVMPPIIAEGVDKYHISRAGYLGLVEILDLLSHFKTLFEANAIHLFDSGREWVGAEKLFIGPLPDAAIAKMFEKRLGSYAPLYRDAFPSLIGYTGGNPRQALRLLNAYYLRRTQYRDNRDAALATTAHRVIQDLLQLGFERFPAEMLALLKRDGYIEAGVLTRPDSRQDAWDILYRNWALLIGQPKLSATRWPVIVNPLVSDAVVWEQNTPEPPELAAVRRWARDHHMNPMGMGIPEDREKKPVEWERVWRELSSSESSEDELSIVGLLEEVASSLFSAYRQDRVFVSYRNPTNLRIALDYLVGKAGTYGPFTCRETHLAGGETEDPISRLIAQTAEADENAIYVVFMEGAWTRPQLQALDRLRDRLGSLQMLWFVDHNALLRYIPHWPQFRQFFRFYVLEDDFLASLNQDEIEADLAVLDELGEGHNDGIQRLRHVLEYLETRVREP